MINIDELMKDYQLDQNMETGEIPLDKQEEARILSNILVKSRLQTSLPVRRKIRPFLVACIIILATFTVSFAAYQYMASQNALGLFSTKSKEEINTINSLGIAINKQVSKNGLTINVKEAIGDRHSVHILFDVIIPKDATPNAAQYTFEDTNIEVPFTTCKGWSVDQLKDSNPNDNIIPMGISLDTREKLIGKKVTLNFTNFSYYNPNSKSGDDIYMRVVSGKWDVTFDLNYKDGSVKYAINKEIQLFGSKANIKEMTLSPISINFVIKGNGIKQYDKTPPPADGSDPFSQEVIIHLKNGETFNMIGSSGRSTIGSKMILNYSFSEILDISKVESVELFGNQYKVSID